MVLPPELIHATIHGDLGTLQTFLDQHPGGADDVANEGPMANRTMSEITLMCLTNPDHGATPRQALQIMRLLLSRGADPNHTLGNTFAATILTEACIIVWSEGVELLLQAGADPNLTCDPTGIGGPSHALSLLLCDSWLQNDPSGRMPVGVARDMHKIVELLLRAGHPLDFLFRGEIRSLESRILLMTRIHQGVPDALDDLMNLARAMRAAQSTSTSTRLTPWQKYCLVPPKELLRLRSLVARGRAREKVRTRRKTPREISLLFAPSFPNELFWKVTEYWNPRA